MSLKKVAPVLFPLFIVACGGGGSSDNKVKKSPQSNMTLSVNKPELKKEAEVTDKDVSPLKLVAKLTNPQGNLYLKLSHTNRGIKRANYVLFHDYADIDIYPKIPNLLEVGEYEDELTISVCTDQNCSNHVKNSPLKVKFSYKINSNIIAPENVFYRQVFGDDSKMVEYSFPIIAKGLKWTATSSEPWLKLNSFSGTGSVTAFKYSVDNDNLKLNSNRAVITFLDVAKNKENQVNVLIESELPEFTVLPEPEFHPFVRKIKFSEEDGVDIKDQEIEVSINTGENSYLFDVEMSGDIAEYVDIIAPITVSGSSKKIQLKFKRTPNPKPHLTGDVKLTALVNGNEITESISSEAYVAKDYAIIFPTNMSFTHTPEIKKLSRTFKLRRAFEFEGFEWKVSSLQPWINLSKNTDNNSFDVSIDLSKLNEDNTSRNGDTFFGYIDLFLVGDEERFQHRFAVKFFKSKNNISQLNVNDVKHFRLSRHSSNLITHNAENSFSVINMFTGETVAEVDTDANNIKDVIYNHDIYVLTDSKVYIYDDSKYEPKEFVIRAEFDSAQSFKYVQPDISNDDAGALILNNGQSVFTSSSSIFYANKIEAEGSSLFTTSADSSTYCSISQHSSSSTLKCFDIKYSNSNAHQLIYKKRGEIEINKGSCDTMALSQGGNKAFVQCQNDGVIYAYDIKSNDFSAISHVSVNKPVASMLVDSQNHLYVLSKENSDGNTPNFFIFNENNVLFFESNNLETGFRFSSESALSHDETRVFSVITNGNESKLISFLAPEM